jgi:hypothetical protein
MSLQTAQRIGVDPGRRAVEADLDAQPPLRAVLGRQRRQGLEPRTLKSVPVMTTTSRPCVSTA